VDVIRSSPLRAGVAAGPLLLALIAVLPGCAASPPEDRVGVGVEVSPDFDRVLEGSLAVVPTVRGPATEAHAGDLAPLARELHAHLYAGLPSTRLVDPDSVRARMRAAGTSADPLVRRLALGDRLLPSDGSALRRALGSRHVLLTWISETVVTGTERPRTDLEVSDFATEGGLARYRRIEGSLHGVVVDLERGEVLWRATEPYRGDPVFGDAPFGSDLDRLRTATAITLAIALESS
jgi:hypothetical protein